MFVECPSGLKGTIRGLKLKEFADLSNPKLLRTGKLFAKLVSTCWLTTNSPGPYAFNSDMLPWDTMLQGDLFKAFMAIRCATFGNEYGFERTCADPMCANKFEFVIDLEAMPSKKLPEASILNVRTGTPFVTTIAGRKVQYRLLIGNDTQLIQRLTVEQDTSMAVAQIMARIVSVEGVEPSDLEALKMWLEELDMTDGIELREQMEASDCGLDTGIIIVCPKCSKEETVDLPLGATFFQRRKKTSTDLKKNVSSGSQA